MHITWNSEKAHSNLGKHGVAFSDAEPVLFDPYGMTVEDEIVDAEQRFITIGIDALGRVLVVVYTHREEDIRLISARHATKQEKKDYETGI